LAKILRLSLRFGEPNAFDRCRDFLREPQQVQIDREYLRQKLLRLALATEELSNFWSP
jgi:hypothetical protein